jgi:hypothetical protein
MSHRDRFGSALKTLGVLAGLTVSIAASPRSATAQVRPPADESGTPYLPVNINPTNVPPAVDINPFGRTPEVDIRRLPPLSIATLPSLSIDRLPAVSVRPTGCDDPANYRTEVGTVVDGPFLLSYLNAAAGTTVRLSSGSQSVEVALGGATPLLATAIHLGADQTLGFDQPVLYSGCSPL